MADFDSGYPDKVTLRGDEKLILVDPMDNDSGLNITADDFLDPAIVKGITDVPGLDADLAAKQTEINVNTDKVSFDSVSSTKLDGIEEGADVTDQANTWEALGISVNGSRQAFLTERGIFELVSGSGRGGIESKSEIDFLIGASSTGDSAKFYNEQGQFIDAVYDSIEECTDN